MVYSQRIDKENRPPYKNHPSFAKKAAKTALSNNKNNNLNNQQIDKVVESVANATKRLSQQSAQSSSGKRKVENRVGPWRLGRTLGKGSTGRVRLAKNTITGQLAAIKIVPKNLIDLENNNNNNNNAKKSKKKRKQKIDENGLPYGIEREIIIMKLISHPNIMALYDVWENNNELYLVLEYVEGGELFDFLINNGRLNEIDAVKYFRMIISGVSYCHKFNICHRDLKPENILLDKNGKIKIADFGMAALETQQKLLETSCGSPHYASPEIVAGKTYHGSPSDVWSCGVILFALLTGHLPFDDQNIRQLLLKVQSGKFHMPSSLSDEAKDLIWSMLRVNPNERIKIHQIFHHPLMLKYPDFTTDKIESKLDHLDISKPIIEIDPDILDNLQTLWHGLPQSHIIKMLRNNDKNPEKMFYYLLENYKLSHMNDSTPVPPPNLKHSISKTALYQQNQNIKSIPRSTSTIITTIEDEDGKILKSHIQKIQPSKSKSSLKHKKSNTKIVASTSFNKSVSFKKMRHDTSASTLSIVNMHRNLSIRHDSSTIDLSKKYRQPSMKFNQVKSNNDSLLIDNSDISNSRSFTVNPKDLPDLPDLQDYRYLVKTIFDNSIDENNNKSTKYSKHVSKIENDLVILDITNSSLSADDFINDNTNETAISSSNYTSSLDPRLNNSVDDKSQNDSTTSTNETELTKLELLQKELSLKNPVSSLQNNRHFSGLRSIKSSSTRKLHTFLQDEYKNVKLNEFNAKHKHLPSVSYSHKTEKSVDSKCYSNEISDTSYSLHSAVEVRLMSPTEEELRNMKDGKAFEDADESNINKNLLPDEKLKNNSGLLIRRNNIVPNVDYAKKSDLRNSLITNTSTNKKRQSNPAFDDAEELIQPNIPKIIEFANDSLDSDITGSLYTSLEEQPNNNSNTTLIDRPFSELKTGVRDSMTPTPDNESVMHSAPSYVKSPLSESTDTGKVTSHPYRAINTTKKKSTRKVAFNPELEETEFFSSDAAEISTKKSNWVSRIVSAFKKVSTDSKSKPNLKSKARSTKTSFFKSFSAPTAKTSREADSRFSFNFRKSKYTPKSAIPKSEYLLESDAMTRAAFIEAIKEDPRTKILKLLSTEKTSNGCGYVFEITNLNTKLRVEIIDKVGSEYGFGGCYLKFIRIKGSKKSFDYWHTIFKDLILELETELDNV
jgi:serine/threonine protein kinase